MKELLNEIDELLTRLEDFTHGKDGEDITKTRAKIAEALRKPAVSSSTYSASEEVEDDRDCDDDFEDEMESEEERRLETAFSCRCGAWSISKKTGKAIHLADCICGAE